MLGIRVVLDITWDKTVNKAHKTFILTEYILIEIGRQEQNNENT